MEQAIQFEVNKKTIRGVLHLPEHTEGEAGFPGIVLCHGFIGNKIGMHRVFVKAARYFEAAGFAVLRFDFSGCGDSDGEHRELTIDGQIQEATAALKYLKTHPLINNKAITLIGLSMGGAVAALTAARQRKLHSLVLWAPVAKMFADIQGIVGGKIFEEVLTTGVAEFEGFELGKPFLESLHNNFPLEAIQEVRAPLLIIHGTGDREITPKNTVHYRKARQGVPYPTKSYFITGADHTFTSHRWEQELFQQTHHWLLSNTNSRDKAITKDKVKKAITLVG